MAVRKLSVVLDLDSGQFTTRIREANGSLKTLSSHAVSASSRIDGVSNSARHGRDAIERMNKAVWKLQLTLASVTFAFGGFTANLVKTNAEAQRSMALLEGLSKSTDTFSRKMEAAADFRYLREFAKTAPYDFKTLTDVFVKLKSAGIDPMAGGMKALVEGVAQFGGNSDILHRAAISIQQMSGKGVVSMEELRQQLGEAVPTAMKMMAAAAGKTVPELVKEVSKGNVLWKDVRDKFFGEMQKSAEGSMERLKKTLPGQAQLIKTNIQNIMLAIGGFRDDGTFSKGGFMDSLTNGARDFNAFLTDPKTIQGAKEFGASLATVLKAAQDLATFVTSHADGLMLLGKVFLIAKSADMAVTAIRNVITATTALGAANSGAAKGTLALVASQLSAAIAQDKAAVAAVETAKDVAAATRGSIDGIKTKIALLNEERVAYERNLQIATAEKAAAAKIVATGRNASGQFVSTDQRADAAKAVRSAEWAMAQNRRELTRITRELSAADTSLATATRGAVIAEEAATAATARLTLASRVATLATGALSATLRGLLTLVGGGLGLAFIAVTMAITGMVSAVAGAKRKLADLNEENKRAKELIQGLDAALAPANQGIKDSGTEADKSADKMKEFAGQTGEAARQLYNLVKARRADTLAQIEQQTQELMTKRSTLERSTLGGAWANLQKPAHSIHEGYDQVAGFVGAAFNTGWAKLWDGKDFSKQVQGTIGETDKQLRALVARRQEFLSDSAPERMGRAMLANGDYIPDTPSKGGGGGKPRVTPDQRAQANIDQLNSTQKSVEHLIMTEDAGSKAFDRMTGKMDAQAEVGKTVSGSLRDQAAEAARVAANNDKAYGIVEGILSDARENASNAGEAIASMGDSYDATGNAIDKYDRKMKVSVAEVMRLHPELKNSKEAMARFNEIVEASKADFVITKIAEAARQLGESLHDMQIENLDPNLQALNGLTRDLDKIKELRDQYNKLPDSSDKAQLLADLDAKEKGFTEEHKRRTEATTAEETRTILEGLMTQDQAAQAHYNRELQRIDALAQAGQLSAEVAAEAKRAIGDQYARDTESEAHRMLREWTDVSGRMKQLSGEWMTDFADKMLEGKFSFKEFAASILMDWLETMARAKLAQATSGLFDFAANTLGRIGAGFLGIPMPIPNGGGDPALAGLYHTGVGPGGEAMAHRMVDPRMFMGAPKFHNGRIPALGPNEMRAIIRKDEGVFTPEQMKAIGKGLSGGGAPHVEVNVINQSGQQLDAEQQGGPRFNGENYIVDVVVKNLQRPGPLRNGIMSVR